MRLIDADRLYEQTAEWESRALAIIEKMNSKPFDEMDASEIVEWRKWSCILTERSAFKHDVFDAPTVEPASPWHRVEEELPNVDEKVLVFAVGKLDGFIGDTVIALTSMSDTNWLNHHEKVDKPYWLDPWQYFLTDYRITHWMPLPEPPQEET